MVRAVRVQLKSKVFRLGHCIRGLSGYIVVVPAIPKYLKLWFAMAFTMAAGDSVARAQAGHVNFSLGWAEVVAGTQTPVTSPDGVLQPGEAARFSVTIDFTPVGTPISYQGGTARVAGFRSSGFGISPTTVQAGAWSGLSITTGFEGSMGFAFPEGNLGFCRVQQPLPLSGSAPIPTDPLVGVWQVNWVPTSYSPRQVGFEVSIVFDDYPTLFVESGPETYALVTAIGHYGESVPVSIAPAPGVAVVFGVAGAVWSRRRRPRGG